MLSGTLQECDLIELYFFASLATDMMVKAKSGTGKTLVFCTLILEKYQPTIKMPQSLIVVPTREISEQIKTYLNDIGAASSGERQQTIS